VTDFYGMLLGRYFQLFNFSTQRKRKLFFNKNEVWECPDFCVNNFEMNDKLIIHFKSNEAARREHASVEGGGLNLYKWRYNVNFSEF